MDKIEKARTRLERALDRLGDAQRRLGEQVEKLKKEPRRGGPEWQTLMHSIDIATKENEEYVAREKRLRQRLDGLINQVATLLKQPAEAGAGHRGGDGRSSDPGAGPKGRP